MVHCTVTSLSDGLRLLTVLEPPEGMVRLSPSWSRPLSPYLVLCEILALFLTTNFSPVGTDFFVLRSMKLGKKATACGTNAQCGGSMTTSLPLTALTPG